MRIRIIFFMLFFFTLNIAWGQVVITRSKTSTQKKETVSKPLARPKSLQEKVMESQEAAGYDVTLSSNIPSAKLYVDGNANGTASGSRFLKTGSHSIRLEAEEYETLTQSITVNSKNTSFYFSLTKKKIVVTSGKLNGHEWVDLGLPSGTKWATTNVGANNPSDYGSFFAWGETSSKSTYTWSNLKYCLDSSGDKFSKYVTDNKFGSVDGKKELDLMDDAAYVNWGSGWRMPSKVQQDELYEKCKWTWTNMGGHNGYKVVGPNGNSIFLPAAGYCDEGSLYPAGSCGNYWSRSLNTFSGNGAYYLYFNSKRMNLYGYNRYYGRSVRPVQDPG